MVKRPSLIVAFVVYALPGGVIVIALGVAARKAHWGHWVGEAIGLGIMAASILIGLSMSAWSFARWAAPEGRLIGFLSVPERRRSISFVLAVLGIGAGAALQWVSPFVG